jgi:hypothetical protein
MEIHVLDRLGSRFRHRNLLFSSSLRGQSVLAETRSMSINERHVRNIVFPFSGLASPA